MWGGGGGGHDKAHSRPRHLPGKRCKLGQTCRFFSLWAYVSRSTVTCNFKRVLSLQYENIRKNKTLIFNLM